MIFKLRIVLLIIVFQGFISCGEDAPECFRRAGDTIRYEIPVEGFSSIYISEGIELVIQQGSETRVTVETGENIREYIYADVIDGELRLTNRNNCNWVRDYNITTVYVTTPQLEKIYSASQFAVRSQGVLSYPSLSLQSGIFNETASGTFELDVNIQHLIVEDNQAAYYVIRGNVENLSVNFYAGDSRFEGTSLIAQKVQVFHRSSNDIIVNPQEEIQGTVYSTGNLVLKNEPPVIDVEVLYTGNVIVE